MTLYQELPSEPSDARAPVVDVGWSSLALVAGLLVGTVVLFDLSQAVDDTVLHLVIAVLGALALDRVVALVQRVSRLPRAAAVLAVVLVVGLLLGGAVAVIAPALVEQVEQIGVEAPAVLDDLAELPVIGRSLQENDVPAQAQRWLDDLPESVSVEGVLGTVGAAALQAAGVVQTLLLLVLLLVEGPALAEAARSTVPLRWRPAAARTARAVHVVVGRYAVGSLLLALLAGTAAFGMGLALGVPLVALAALWAFLWNFVPQLGGIVGGSLLVLLAAGVSLRTALLALVVWLVYMQVENRVVQPVVVGRAVSLSPLTTMVVALLGVAVAGLAGAVLAIPLVAAANAALGELRPSRGLP